MKILIAENSYRFFMIFHVTGFEALIIRNTIYVFCAAAQIRRFAAEWRLLWIYTDY